MRGRYYARRLARLISEDPIGLAGGYNLYGYVGQGPIQYVDPLGLAEKPKPWFDTKGADSIDGRQGPSDQSGRVPRTGDPIEKTGEVRPDWREKAVEKAVKWIVDRIWKNATGFPAIFAQRWIAGAIWGMRPTPVGCAELDCNGNGIPDFSEPQMCEVK
ncbi:MAG: hypothetical protein GC151_03330 [Betaproteobacteria bacterium]|nr:hypothetical protein [Betaproteobacteria bacterium]